MNSVTIRQQANTFPRTQYKIYRKLTVAIIFRLHLKLSLKIYFVYAFLILIYIIQDNWKRVVITNMYAITNLSKFIDRWNCLFKCENLSKIICTYQNVRNVGEQTAKSTVNKSFFKAQKKTCEKKNNGSKWPNAWENFVRNSLLGEFGVKGSSC